MITVTIYKKDQEIVGFQSKGHAGYDSTGKDIICAAVSVLILNTLQSIMKFTDDTFEGNEDAKKGLIEFQLTDKPSNETRVLLNSLELGLTEVQKGNSRYLRIKFKEV